MRHITRRRLNGAFAAITLTWLASCGAPSFGFFGDDYEKPATTGGMDSTGNPKVNDVLDHVACELSRSLLIHLGDPNKYPFPPPGSKAEAAAEAAASGDDTDWKLWNHIIEDNFIASIDLELQVTNVQGVNASLNFITPFTPIPIPSAGAMPGSFTGNFTLAVGGQLSGNQYRTFDFTYLIDLATLYKRMQYHYWKDHESEMPYVKYQQADSKGVRLLDIDAMLKPCAIQMNPFGSQLEGSLFLEEILTDGLVGIRKAKLYSMFSMPDRVNAIVSAAPTVAHPESDFQEKNFHLPNGSRLVPTPPSAVQKRPSATPPAAITFSSDLDFTVAAGLNGGPNWTLTHFTGPSGGGGGGGGAGGSGGGGGRGGTSGGGAGGGGAGGPGLINLNRTAIDSLTITVGATCRVGPPNATPSTVPFDNYWAAVPLCGDEAQLSDALQNLDERFRLSLLASQIRRGMR